jgi:hypothetical protein
MPRVNRDLQRRLAARRERERRRPTERRYQFASRNEPALAPDEPIVDGEPVSSEESLTEAQADGVRTSQAPGRAGAAPRTPSPRESRGAVARPAPRPFSAYRDEYRYVIGDLRRILLVTGSLLLVLIVLALVLPR